jgi:hypothetical protein
VTQKTTAKVIVTIEQAREDEDTHQWLARLHRENAQKAARLAALRLAVSDGPAALLRFQAMEAREEAERLLAVAASKEAQAAEMEAADAR